MGRASYRSQVSDYGVQRRTVFLVGQGRETLLGLFVFVQYAGGQIAGKIRHSRHGLPRPLQHSRRALGVAPLQLARARRADGARPVA